MSETLRFLNAAGTQSGGHTVMIHHNSSSVELEFKGDLTENGAVSSLCQLLKDMKGSKKVVLDLSEVTKANDLSLRTILKAYMAYEQQGGRVAISLPRGQFTANGIHDFRACLSLRVINRAA